MATVKTLHETFLRLLMEVLEGKDENGVSTMSPAWGAVIRAFLKDNHDKLDAKTDEAEVSELAKAFLARRPPRGLQPGIDIHELDS